MNIENEKQYSEVVYKVFEYCPIFEEALKIAINMMRFVNKLKIF